MKYLVKIMSVSAVVLLAGCAGKASAPAQIHTPDEQTVMVDGKKQRLPIAATGF